MHIRELINKYEGARVAVLGSGPTLLEYQNDINRESDITIACNGSLMALAPTKHTIDYFIYGDRASPKRQWFLESQKFKGKTKTQTKRVLPTFLLPYNSLAVPNEKNRIILLEELVEFEKTMKSPDDYIYFRPEVRNIITNNAVIFDYDELVSERIRRQEGPLCRGGTITGVATQLAYKMGASKINLFGCGFNNPNNRGNYAYNPKGEFGQTTQTQIENMNKIIYNMQKQGLKIVSFGKTNLDVQMV